MTTYRWVWNADLKRWGLMIDADTFPVGCVGEQDGQAYWIPFGVKVMGRQVAASVEEAKAALLEWLKGDPSEAS